MNKLLDKLTKAVAIIFGVPIAIMTLAVILYSSSDGFRSFMNRLVSSDADLNMDIDPDVNFEVSEIKDKSFVKEVNDPSVNVEHIFDEELYDGYIYKVSGMRMDYFILEEAYNNEEATGHKDYERTVNDFMYSVLIQNDTDKASKYITKADSRALEAHENADEAYEALLKNIDITVEQVKSSNADPKDTGYCIRKAAGGNVNGVDLMVVTLTFYYYQGEERITGSPMLFMQKDKNGWMIVSSS